MALNHKQKRNLMKRLHSEDDQGVPLHASHKWRARKWQIQQRVKRQQTRAKYHSEVRKGQRGQKETANDY